MQATKPWNSMELQKRRLKVVELVFLEMGKELDRATPFGLDDELHFVGKVGGNSLTLPNPDVLLNNPFQSRELDLRDSRNVVDLQWNLDPNPGSDLGGGVVAYSSSSSIRRRRRRL